LLSSLSRQQKQALILTLLLWLLILSGIFSNTSLATPLPDMGNSYSKALSPAQEKALGQAVMREIRQKLPLITDPEINDYLQSLGNQLTNHIEAPPHDFTFFAINDPSINAFAAPGGYIGIHTGLILATENESELASVLAHEIGHITQAHFARRMEEIERMTLPRAAAFIAGVLLASIDPELGYATLIATDAASIERQLGFSRNYERESDRVGLTLLSRAGFSPAASVSFLQKLQTFSGTDSQPIDFLLTHPLTEARMADIQNRVRQLPVPTHQDSHEYTFVRAALEVLTDPQRQSVVKKAREAVKQAPDLFSYRYRLGIAYLHNEQPEKAEAVFAQLMEDDSPRISYFIALLKSVHSDSSTEKSTILFEAANRLYPNHPTLTFHHCNNLIQANHADEAYQILRRHLLTRSATPELYQLAARSAAESGNETAGHRYLAEYYFERAYYRLALEHLEKAIDKSWKRPVEAESHQARKQEIENFVEQRLNH
jgi:predicted Zn-dependent protease